MELEEAIEIYNELEKNKKVINNIDADFFFKFAETVLKELKSKDDEINFLKGCVKIYMEGK